MTDPSTPQDRAAWRRSLRETPIGLPSPPAVTGTVSQRLVASPNAPRPTGTVLEIADMLRRIEANYEREGSGPGSRFEGRLLEDVQAAAIVRRLRELRLLGPEPLG